PRGRDKDAGRIGAGLADGLDDGVEDRHGAIERRLAALAGRDPGDDVGAVVAHLSAVEVAFATGDPLDHQPGIGPDQDAHAGLAGAVAARREASTALAAASSSEAAVVNLASSSRAAASAALVPTIRTTIGTSRSWTARASIRPLATSSPRVIPPKMLTRIAFTFGSARMI